MATTGVDVRRIVYLTELTGMRVDGPNGHRIGRVRDAAIAPREHPRRVSRYLVGGGRSLFTIRYDQVASISFDRIQISDDRFVPYYPDENLLLLSKDLLDQQIVDVNGRKVVRVNDVLLRTEHIAGRDELWVQEVAVGLQSAFRRIVEGVLSPSTIRKIQHRIKPNAIPWEYCNIVEPDERRRLKLLISHHRLGQLHPADLADIVEELAPPERQGLFETLDEEVAAQALAEIEPRIRVNILNTLDRDRAANIVEHMEPDTAADLLQTLEKEDSEEILRDMQQAPAAEVEELLDYEHDTAGGMMNTHFIALHKDATVRDAVEALKGNENLLKILTHLFLIDEEERLVAAVSLGRLLLADEHAPLRSLAFRETVQVSDEDDIDHVVEVFDKYNLYALPVVDEDGKLSGVITADDVISTLRPRTARG
jgi:CBS domain-containing protein